MPELPAAIAALPHQADALRERLERWCAVNSGSGNVAGLAHMAALLETACREITPEVERLALDADGRCLVRATRRPHAAVQVLCSGHYDTVYGAESPFQSCTRLDAATLRGPGVADMKGGVVVLLAALQAFEATPGADQLGWEVLLTPDEEIGSAASRPQLEAAAGRAHVGLVFEPARANGDLVGSRKGVGGFVLTCHGRAAHAGVDPASGRNAILGLTERLLELRGRAAQLPGVLVNVGRIHGGGPTNIVPDRAEAHLDVRCSTPAEADAFTRELERLARSPFPQDGLRLEVAGGFDRPPMARTPATTALAHGVEAAAAELGLAPFGWADAGGGSDASLLQAAGLPCLDGLGPVGGHLHSPDEYIRLPSLTERAQLAALVLHHLATGRWPLPPRPTGA